MTANRNVRMTPELVEALSHFQPSTCILFAWGEPDADGFYTPTVIRQNAAHADAERSLEGVAELEAAYNLVAADYHEAEVEAGWHSAAQDWTDCDGSLCRSHRQYRDAALAATTGSAVSPSVTATGGERHEHEWHYYDGNEMEGTESACACGAVRDDETGTITPPATPPASDGA